MVPLKVKISPYLQQMMESVIEDEIFSSASDLVNVSLSEFFVNHDFGFDEVDDLGRLNSSISMLLCMTLMDKGIVTSDDIKTVVEKLKTGDIEGGIMDTFGGIFGEIFSPEYSEDEGESEGEDEGEDYEDDQEPDE